jgi:anti-sigma B factor antagonist
MNTGNKVFIKKLPERLDLNHTSEFLREMEEPLGDYKPQVVLDCSDVQQIDSAGIQALLRCMEKAMKQDGDMKLAALSPEASVVLRLTRVDRVFEIFDTVSEAANSFVGFAADEPVSITARTPSFDLRNADLDIAG